MGKLVNWTTGINREWLFNLAAATFMGDKDSHALPDSLLFPAETGVVKN